MRREKDSLKLFENVLNDAKELYLKHAELKMDSWRDMTVRDMKRRFWEEMIEFEIAYKQDDISLATRKEALDMINFLVMIIAKLDLMSVGLKGDYARK